MLNHNRNIFLEGWQISDMHFQMLPCREWKSKLEYELLGLWYPSFYQQKVPGDLEGRQQCRGAQADGAQLGAQDGVRVKGTWSLGEGSIHPHNLGSTLLDSSLWAIYEAELPGVRYSITSILFE